MHTHQGLGREAGLRYRLLRKCARGCGLLVGLLFVLAVPGTGHGEEPVIAYTPNPLMTTPFGPASADILLRPSNFLPCQGGPIALCYYSGPEPADSSQPDLSCVVTENGEFANCRCVEIPVGPYYVDINSILDVELYQKTVKKCGKNGADCRGQPNKAPVCQAINDNALFAREGAQTISTFSFALNSSQGFKLSSLNCDAALYAGCMTAPCVRSGDSIEICDDTGGACSAYPVDVCACPTFDGPYQVGKEGAACDIGAGDPGDNAWSAAYNPLQGDTAPRPGCFPDAPGDRGCPLLAAIPGSNPPEPVIPAVPADISCGKVCAEYRKNVQAGVQVDFTCDATLCTATGRDVGLVNEACTGLNDGKIGEILRLETEVGCSCCASQLCGCEADELTDEEMFMLNQKQRDRNITPQCDINGTLCGSL